MSADLPHALIKRHRKANPETGRPEFVFDPNDPAIEKMQKLADMKAKQKEGGEEKQMTIEELFKTL